MTSQSETVRNLPAVIAGDAAPRPAAARPRTDAAYAAQALGAGGERRGLKGGRVVLDAARAAYLETQWAGVTDRRIPPGALKRTCA